LRDSVAASNPADRKHAGPIPQTVDEWLEFVAAADEQSTPAARALAETLPATVQHDEIERVPAQGALDFATVYATERHQFGKPISSFQMVQQMLADMAIKVEAARALIYTAARAVDAGAPNLTKMAAMCKTYATDVAMEVTTNAVQIFGGNGYMRNYPVEKYMRDAKITQIYEGTNQIQRLVIARNIIKEAAEHSHLKEYIPVPEALR